MGKKHKNLFKYLTVSIVFIILMVAVGNVYSNYNPTKEQFLTDNASGLLRKTDSSKWLLDGFI